MRRWRALTATRRPTGNEVAEHEALLVKLLAKEREQEARAALPRPSPETTPASDNGVRLFELYRQRALEKAQGAG